MLSIGDFARAGRVSVRMLRHYDAIGLLRPARVDASTGYRSYTAGQLALLNRIVALKELGLTLAQVQQVVESAVTVDEIRGMLTLRRAELETRIQEDTARLAHVQARLRIIESEGQMSAYEVVIKSVPALRVAELTGSAKTMDPSSIGPVVRGLYERLCTGLDRAGIAAIGPAVAYYEDAGDDENVVVHAALPVDANPDGDYEFAVVDLRAEEHVASLLHKGSMDNCLPAYQALAQWIDAAGYLNAGPSREVTLACPEDVDGWVTELQEPVAKA